MGVSWIGCLAKGTCRVCVTAIGGALRCRTKGGAPGVKVAQTMTKAGILSRGCAAKESAMFRSCDARWTRRAAANPDRRDANE
jgi:hypothetical protein